MDDRREVIVLESFGGSSTLGGIDSVSESSVSEASTSDGTAVSVRGGCGGFFFGLGGGFDFVSSKLNSLSSILIKSLKIKVV